MRSMTALGMLVALTVAAAFPSHADASIEPLVMTFEAAPQVKTGNLVLVFPVAIKLDSARIEIFDGHKKKVQIERLEPGRSDIEVNVPLKTPLSPGIYTVKWRAVSVGGKRVRGAYNFNVDP